MLLLFCYYALSCINTEDVYSAENCIQFALCLSIVHWQGAATCLVQS